MMMLASFFNDIAELGTDTLDCIAWFGWDGMGRYDDGIYDMGWDGMGWVHYVLRRKWDGGSGV